MEKDLADELYEALKAVWEDGDSDWLNKPLQARIQAALKRYEVQRGGEPLRD
jgi:hypothetical protein